MQALQYAADEPQFPQFETIETELFDPVWVRDTFEKLLRVFYHELYDPLQWEDLELMTEIADYLLALPSLARGLHMNCIANPSLATACRETPESILHVAMKLRNKILFKEGIMCIINPWSLKGQRIESIENEKVRALAQSTFDGIELKVSKALHKNWILLVKSVSLNITALEDLSTSCRNLAPSWKLHIILVRIILVDYVFHIYSDWSTVIKRKHFSSLGATAITGKSVRYWNPINLDSRFLVKLLDEMKQFLTIFSTSM